MKRLASQIALLVLLIAFVQHGISHTIPDWLQVVAFVFRAAFLLAASLYLLLHRKNGTRYGWGQIALLPKQWQRWIYDEPEGSR